MKVLLALALLGCALAVSADRNRRQSYGNGINLQPSGGGYLPPPVNQPCYPSTVYRTQMQYSTQIIPSTVYNNDVQYQTRTSFRTQQVFTTIYSEIVRTQVVPQIQYQTITVTRTQENTRTQVINLPPQINYITRTQQVIRTQVQFQTRFVTRTQRVPTTITRNVVSTQVVNQQVISTIFQTQTVTRTQQLPGQTRTIQSTRFSTIYSTMIQRGQDVVRTQYVTRTNYRTQVITQPGQTQVIFSTQIVPFTTTLFSQFVLTNTQTQFVTRTQFQQQVSTVYSTQRVPQYNTRTVTVPQPVVQTQYSTQVIPTTIYSQQTVQTFVNVPGQTQYITVTRTDYSTQFLPGQTRTQYQTRTVYNTNYVTSTIYSRQVYTVTATRTSQPMCNTQSGYNYQRPAMSFNPYGR